MSKRESGPFKHAKVGDWIIDSNGRCHQIKSIEEGNYGGVRIHNHLRFFWDGNHIPNKGEPITARMATAEEIANWQRQEQARNEEIQAEIEQQRAADRIRDAAPDLLAALTELLRVDDEWHGSVNSEMASARQRARAAIAKARGKA